MPAEWRNETNESAMGGTEQMMEKIYSSELLRPYLDDFQIIPSRVRELQEGKYRIYYLHDLPQDPESQHLRDGGHAKFNKLVFVSHWQMNEYVRAFNIPYSKCCVIQNAIEPFEECGPVVDISKNDPIRLIYHTTPHRGLKILVPVFEKLCERFYGDKTVVHLDVYSSFSMYGWDDMDKNYEDLFDRIVKHPQMTYHGYRPNSEIREALVNSHIFAYPSIWLETSCLALIEAMQAGVVCVHPNLGALPETSAGLTLQYQMHEDVNEHANMHYNVLEKAILELANEDNLETEDLGAGVAKSYAHYMYDWNVVQYSWMSLFEYLLNNEEPVEEKPSASLGDSDKFVFSTG